MKYFQTLPQPNNVIEVHTPPSARHYQFVEIYKRGETPKSAVLRELSLEVDKVLR